jgi:hypothetical protein
VLQGPVEKRLQFAVEGFMICNDSAQQRLEVRVVHTCHVLGRPELGKDFIRFLARELPLI